MTKFWARRCKGQVSEGILRKLILSLVQERKKFIPHWPFLVNVILIFGALEILKGWKERIAGS
jgi:hypothetical protein